MTPDEGDDVVARYRAVARELPGTTMDATILLAASRAIRGRTQRTWYAAAAAAAIVIALGALLPHAAERTSTAVDPPATYGQLEGRSRLFLTRESGLRSIGPGSTSFIRTTENPNGERE